MAAFRWAQDETVVLRFYLRLFGRDLTPFPSFFLYGFVFLRVIRPEASCFSEVCHVGRGTGCPATGGVLCRQNV